MGHVYPYWQIMLTKHSKAVNNFTQGIAQLCPRLWAFMPEIVG